MYSPLMGWIVSLTTTFRISALAGKEKRATVAAVTMRRTIEEVLIFAVRECIGPRLAPDDKTIVPLFSWAGVNFLWCRRCGRSRNASIGSPSRQVSASRNQAGPSFVGNIGPCRLNENHKAVAEADEV